MWWKLLAGAVAIALAGFLILQYGKARENEGVLEERVRWKNASIASEQRLRAIELEHQRQQTRALNGYMDRLALMEPVIVHSRDTVTRYAQTAAGSAPCLAPDRVLGVEQTRSELFPGYPGPAVEGARAVPANPDGD